MCYYVYTDHAQYTIKTYAKMALFRLILTDPLPTAAVPFELDSNHVLVRTVPFELDSNHVRTAACLWLY